MSRFVLFKERDISRFVHDSGNKVLAGIRCPFHKSFHCMKYLSVAAGFPPHQQTTLTWQLSVVPLRINIPLPTPDVGGHSNFKLKAAAFFLFVPDFVIHLVPPPLWHFVQLSARLWFGPLSLSPQPPSSQPPIFRAAPPSIGVKSTAREVTRTANLILAAHD